jgi:DNA-binding NarL/FixJ family response regulator
MVGDGGVVSRTHRVVVVDDHHLVRDALRALFERHDDLEVVGEASTVDDAVATVTRTDPDLVLLDLRLGEEDGTDVARRLRAQGSTVTILVLSVHDSSRYLREALAAGADGYLLKSVSGAGLAEGIRKAIAGDVVIGQEFVSQLLEDVGGMSRERPDLTPREQEVLEGIAGGLTNREIAERLEISTRTAQKHVENLFKKFRVHDRTELAARAFRIGLLG